MTAVVHIEQLRKVYTIGETQVIALDGNPVPSPALVETLFLGAAERIDAGQAGGEAGEVLALQARAVVADSVERIIRQVGHALGPAPLAFDEEHARRVADLELYVRQHHAEADLARLGSALVAAEQQRRAAP